MQPGKELLFSSLLCTESDNKSLSAAHGRATGMSHTERLLSQMGQLCCAAWQSAWVQKAFTMARELRQAIL